SVIDQRRWSNGRKVYDVVSELSKPVIARINGHAFGGGLELACDVRIVSPGPTLGFPEHKIGLIPGLGGCSRFVHIVGSGKAKDPIFTGELVEGTEAHEIGLAERLDDDPVAAAREYAESLCEQPPQALGLAKQVVNATRDADTKTAGLLESLAQSALLATEDHREGVDAFREKREPEFTGE
ncbi:MAG: enoyl-CoA hydratase/isomerase family protein, partial [Natronomonas sp.]|nr:enoyl-CoA hydratase/isomerase family protein [Natronomonas sp.]